MTLLADPTVKVEKIGPYEWRLIEDYKTPYGTIPRGFVTDGASVPRILWSVISPATRFFEAAITHDWMLFRRDMMNDDLTVKQCSLVFADMAIKTGAKPWVVYPATALVHLWTSIRRM